MKAVPDYKAGDSITYRTLSGVSRTVTVTDRNEDIKNGCPGFDGVMADGSQVWGYDSDIIRVVSK